jgi:hypothetical protein
MRPNARYKQRNCSTQPNPFEGREYWTGGVQVFVRLSLCPLSEANRMLMGLAEHRYGYKNYLKS